MGRRIAVIQGHPDPSANRFGHALAAAYADGAKEGGHEVVGIDVAGLDFPLLRSKQDFEQGAPPEAVYRAQQTIEWAEHLVFVYPLWLGSMPALLKGFLEQVFRPGFAMEKPLSGIRWKKRLVGKSARIVVTMGMPAIIYRWYFRAHSLKSLERNILGFCGISPIRETLIGAVDSLDSARRGKWLGRLHSLGRNGQ